MPVTADKPAPYAPSSAVLDIVSRYRNRGLPPPINAEVLGRAGIAESLIPRTVQALQSLDLIDKDGAPTPIFEGLRLAPEAEYRDRMADWLRSAYADIFLFVDPAKDDSTRIRDAFRNYNPIGQQDRMVTLFQGLCAAAGLITKKSKSEKPARAAAPSTFTPRQRTAAKRVVNEKFKIAERNAERGLAAGLPPPLAGLLAGLPAEGDTWSRAERDKFFNAFGAVLDFCFPIGEAAEETKEAAA